MPRARKARPSSDVEPASYRSSSTRPLLPGRCTCKDAFVTQDISLQERQLLADLLAARGRAGGSFVATLQHDGLVRVSGPRGTAFYPRDSWFTHFSRHLEKSFFDPAVPAPTGPRMVRKGAPDPLQPA